MSRSRDTRFRDVRVFHELSSRSSRSTGKGGTRENKLGTERIRKRYEHEDERRKKDAGCAPTCPRGIGSRGLRRAWNRRPARFEATEGATVRREKKGLSTDTAEAAAARPRCRRTAPMWEMGDRRKSPVRRSQLNPSARGRPLSVRATISPKGTQP